MEEEGTNNECSIRCRPLMWSLLLNEQISDDMKQKLRSFYPKAVTGILALLYS